MHVISTATYRMTSNFICRSRIVLEIDMWNKIWVNFKIIDFFIMKTTLQVFFHLHNFIEET